MMALRGWLVGVVAALMAFGAQAQRGGGGFFDDEPVEPVAVSAMVDRAAVAPGETVVIGVLLDHEDHYHSWPSLAQDVLPPEIAEFAIRTDVRVVSDLERWGSVAGIQWPEPSPAEVPDLVDFEGTVSVPTYSGRAMVYMPIQIAPDAEPGQRQVDVMVDYQACDDSTCYAPQQETLRVSFDVDPSAGAGADEARPADFLDFDPGVVTEAPPPETGTPETDESAPATVELQGQDAAVATTKIFGIELPTGGPAGLLALAVAGALGGLVLNLTPCVLPVIPIKVMTLTQHAGESKARAMFLGLMMAAGVVAFWLGIGIPVAFLTGVTDPSQVFGIWWVTAGIGVIIAAMSLGLLGMFELTLPQSVYAVNPKADTPFGSFLFGVMTAVLGLPCFGFVAGALVPGAATQGSGFVLVLFTAMGVGMAAPYLILSAKPELVNKVPRTGPASELVKQVMGLLLLAAAAYFFGSGMISLVTEKPYLAKQLHIWTAAILFVATGLWLTARTFKITSRPLPRMVFTLVSIGFAAAGLGVALSFTGDARNEYETRQAALASAGQGATYVPGIWNDYSETLVDRALNDGKVIALDFTAEWCVNCKALEKAVLGRDPAAPVLRSDDVVMVKVDLTNRNSPGWDLLRDEFNQAGIPTLAIYSQKNEESPWVANAYTGSQVVEAIERAKSVRPQSDAGQGTADVGPVSDPRGT